MRLRRTKIPVVLLLLSGLLLNPTVCPASELEKEIARNSTTDTFLDVVFYRTVGLVAIPVGAVLFTISLPFSALGRNVGDSFDSFVATPARYTFVRPLGDI